MTHPRQRCPPTVAQGGGCFSPLAACAAHRLQVADSSSKLAVPVLRKLTTEEEAMGAGRV